MVEVPCRAFANAPSCRRVRRLTGLPLVALCLAAPLAAEHVTISPEMPTRHTPISVRADFAAGPFVDTQGYTISGRKVEVFFVQDGVDPAPALPFAALVEVPPLPVGDWTFEVSINDGAPEVFDLTVEAGTPLGVLGATDQVPAATLLVPLFEVGVDAATHPHDTLLVVYNTAPYEVTFRYQVWDVHGVPVPGLAGHATLASGASWSDGGRLLLAAASGEDRAQLLDGDFYRGFATFDLVSEATDLTPMDASYPFANDNRLLGYAYYTRLAAGSANGLAMVPIESVPPGASPGSINSFLTGFYGELLCPIHCPETFAHGGRETLDLRGRQCATRSVHSDDDAGSCHRPTPPGGVLRTRLFGDEDLAASSRTIVFSWLPLHEPAAPTPVCDDVLGFAPDFPCERDFAFVRRREDGSVAAAGRLELDRVVTVIEHPGGLGPGEMLIEIAPTELPIQWYVFSFNTARPPGQPGVNWDAVFAGSVEVVP